MKPKISGVIIAHNEATVIGRCIASLLTVADEVVVVDSGSSDDTMRISREMGAVIVEQPFLSYGRQKQFAVQQATHDYIISLDADEWLSAELINSFRAEQQAGLKNAYTAKRVNSYLGKWVRFGGWHTAKMVRFFDRNHGNWNSDIVHESVEMKPGTTIGHLKGEILHEPYDDINEHLAKVRKYASLGAEKLQSKSLACLLLKLIASPFFRFLTMYVIKLGFLDGWAGLQLASVSTYETWLKYRLAVRMKMNG